MENLPQIWNTLGSLSTMTFIKMSITGALIFAVAYFLYGKIPTLLKIALLIVVVSLFGNYGEYIADSGYHNLLLLVFGYFVVCSFWHTKMLNHIKQLAYYNGGGGISQNL
ncbi:hypothetical protein ACWIUD_10395 [Helicobacter sp. 23-1044]